jgi:hypothetical protein
VNRANDILEELKAWNSPLADMPRVMPYAVPEGYFSSLAELALLANTAEPMLNLSKAMPYAVPAGYFESLADNITARAKGPSLPLSKENPFTAPAGYFDNLPRQMLAAAKKAEEKPAKKEETKIIPLGRTIWEKARWAVAAMLILGIGFGSYKFMTGNDYDAEKQLASLPANTISDYVTEHIDEFDTDPIEMIAANDVELNPNSLSDEEIMQYLDQTGGWEEKNIN